MRISLSTLLAATLLASACATTPTLPTAPAPAAPAPLAENSLRRIDGTPPLPASPLIRVGLLSDQARVTFARIDGGYHLVTGQGSWILRRGFTATGPLADAKTSWGVQVSAISDRTSAEGLARKIEAETGEAVTLLFDAKDGLYRVIAGTFADQDAGRPFAGRLTQAGYGKDMLVVRRPSTDTFTPAIRLVDDEGAEHVFNDASILLLPVTASSIAIGGSPYRGGARLHVNPRGTLNVINELNLEDYARGVVPAEMGPRVYDELEAIKAQALAARTYAVRRLGEYSTEGFDICPTPACQVYKGMSIEEPLSDQAIKETAGLIIVHQGEAIDSLFSAACGGATSDVDTMFPGRNEPYLRGVSCIESDVQRISGRADGPLMTDLQLEARLFEILAGAPPAGSWSASDVVRATEAAARVAGVRLPVSVVSDRAVAAALTPPRSSRRGDVLRYLADALGAAEHARSLIFRQDVDYFFPNRKGEQRELRAAAFLIKYRIVPAQAVDRIDFDAAMPRDEYLALMMSWLRKRELFNEATGRIAALSGRRVSLKTGGKVTAFDLSAGTPMFRRTIDRVQEYASLPLMMGDRATLLRRRDGQVVAAIVQTNYDGAAFDRTSSLSNWVRSYRADELVTTINRRNPIQSLTDLRPVRIDQAHRHAEFDVIAEGGRAIRLRGLPVRWSLNVPDNLFTFERSTDPDGTARYTFFGKGWGHGTGMCQEGAFGMAIRGRTAAEIVKHYYTGVEIVPFKQ